jgi:hypothetical protein
VAGAMVAALGLGTTQAKAEDEETAEKRFKEGKELLGEKRYGEACQKFEESQQAAPASGAQLALAYCQELSGLLATSYRSYLAAEALAKAEGHEERSLAARERSNALKERVSTLTIVVPSSVAKLPGLQLSLDGKPLPATAFGTAIPVDGGAHYIEASAPNRASWDETVLLEGEHHRKTVIVPILDPLLEGSASAAPPGAPPRASSPPEDASRDADTNTARHVSLALGAGSLLTLGAGVFFGVKAYSKNDASNSNGHCDSTGCDAQGAELRREALSAARVSTWFFATSGVLALSGVTLYFVSTPSPKRSASVGASVGPNGAQLSLQSSF